MQTALYAFGFFLFRYGLSVLVTGVIAAHITDGRRNVLRVINATLASTLFNITVNVTVFLFAVYGLQSWLGRHAAAIVITSVYAGSVMHMGFTVLSRYRLVADIARHVARHGWHGPKRWVRTQIARAVENRFVEMNMLQKWAYRVAGGPAPNKLTDAITRQVWPLVAARGTGLVVVVAIYVVVFNLFTRPVLLEHTTGLNWLQAFAWPFALAIDEVFGTRLAEWVRL